MISIVKPVIIILWMINLRSVLRQLKYLLWVLNGYIGLESRSESSLKATILIAYYNPLRMKHINHQLRNIFKCNFVERVIISNHNPETKIDSQIKIKDGRLIILNQNVRKGCGYRWLLANEFSPDYLIVLDDDILMFPWQLQKLFNSLISEPETLHGFAGMVQMENNVLEYYEREERDVDFIGEVYAITGEQLKGYIKFREKFLVNNTGLRKSVDYFADFVVLSKAIARRPRIHDAGRLFRCPTYDQVGVAVHKERGFREEILAVAKALNMHS